MEQRSPAQCNGNWKQPDGSHGDHAGLSQFPESSCLKLFFLRRQIFWLTILHRGIGLTCHKTCKKIRILSNFSNLFLRSLFFLFLVKKYTFFSVFLAILHGRAFACRQLLEALVTTQWFEFKGPGFQLFSMWSRQFRSLWEKGKKIQERDLEHKDLLDKLVWSGLMVNCNSKCKYIY